RSDLGFFGNLDGCSWFLALPSRGEMLDPGNQVSALLLGECIPWRHDGAIQSAGDRVVQIFIGRKCAGRGRTALEDSRREVPWSWINPLCGFAVAITHRSVTNDAVSTIGHSAIFSVPGQVADVTGGGRRVK